MDGSRRFIIMVCGLTSPFSFFLVCFTALVTFTHSHKNVYTHRYPQKWEKAEPTLTTEARPAPSTQPQYVGPFQASFMSCRSSLPVGCDFFFPVWFEDAINQSPTSVTSFATQFSRHLWSRWTRSDTIQESRSKMDAGKPGREWLKLSLTMLWCDQRKEDSSHAKLPNKVYFWLSF